MILPLNFSCTVDLYADDTTLHVIVNKLLDIKNKLSTELDKLNHWCVTNKVIKNINKSKWMFITTSQRRTRMPNAGPTAHMDFRLTPCHDRVKY